MMAVEIQEWVSQLPTGVWIVAAVVLLVLVFWAFIEGRSIRIGRLLRIGPRRQRRPKQPAPRNVQLRSLRTTKDVSDYLSRLRVDHESRDRGTLPDRLIQTHIKSGRIPPSIDIVSSYLALDRDERPMVERIILISRPLDIDFAAHSLELSEVYGTTRISLQIVFEPLRTLPSYPNFTLVRTRDGKRYEVLLSFPFLPSLPLRNLDEDHTAGIVFSDREVYEIVEQFLTMSRNFVANRQPDRTPMQILEEAKCTLWHDDRREYCRAIAFSITSAVWSDRAISAELLYTGLVGSAQLDKNSLPPRDLDLILLLRNHPPTRDLYDHMKTRVGEVLRRYNNDDVVFEDFWYANPVKGARRSKAKDGREAFPVHVLLNTPATVRRWSSFIACHRRRHREDLQGEFPKDVVPCDFPLVDLLTQFHGVKSLMQSLTDQEVKDMKWEEQGEVMGHQLRSIAFDTDEILAAFLQYTVRWTTRNIYEARDSTLRWGDWADELAALENLCSVLGLEQQLRATVAQLLQMRETGALHGKDLDRYKTAVLIFLQEAQVYCQGSM